MKTINLTYAKVGTFYKLFDGVFLCYRPNTYARRFVDRNGNQLHLSGVGIELPPECDSFDWVPPAADTKKEADIAITDSMMNAMGYHRCDADPAPKETDTVLTDLVSGKWVESDEVRWYLNEWTGSIRWYFGTKSMVVYRDGSSDNTCVGEQQCIADGDTRLSTAEALCRLASSGHNDAWHAARKLVGMDESEAYLAGQSVCGIKPGDTVRVVRSSCSFEMGWEGMWDIRQDTEVHQDVDGIHGTTGVWFNSHCYYPFFVLEKIETPSEPEKRLGETVAEGLKEFADELEATRTPVKSPEVAPEIDPGEIHTLTLGSVWEVQDNTGEWRLCHRKGGFVLIGIHNGLAMFSPCLQIEDAFDGYPRTFIRQDPITTDVVNPGEGWRLVSKDEPLHIEDEYLGVDGRWYRTSLWATCPAAEKACRAKKFTYRRRIQPEADHGFKVGDWVRCNGRTCKIESIQGFNVNTITDTGGVLLACIGELTKVRFRPFADAAEFKPYRDQWFERKDGTAAMRFSYIRDSGADHNAWEYLFRTYQFENGQPFGIAEDVK